RIAAILHFFNPVIWIANRVIDQLREYACDDVAAALCQASAVESGEAFVRTLQHAGLGRRGLVGALGIFGLDARASCLRRVRRLLDTDPPLRTPTGGWSLCGLLLLAALALPHLRAAGSAILANPQDAGAESVTRDVQEFELRVVGPGGKPVSGAVVELSGHPRPMADQIRKGKLARE